MKKCIILFLLAFMSLTVSAQNPEKIGDYWYTISTSWWDDGGVVLVKDPTGKDYSGNVVISGEVTTADGVTRKVVRIGDRAFSGCNILSVTIKGKFNDYGNGTLSIGSHAFSLCKSLSSVVIGEGVTGIGNYAFYGCENLATVVVGDNVTGIGWQAFQNCSSLKSVSLGKRVNYIGRSSFVDCPELKDVYCYRENGSPYQDGGRVFNDEQLQSLTLHVPENSYSNYIFDVEDNYPWQHFGKVEKFSNPTIEQCATPKISYASGNVSFTCETPDVAFNSTVEYVENSFNNASKFPAPSHFRVRVVAVKDGYLPSEAAEQEFALADIVDANTGDYKAGDVNRDGHVNSADRERLTNVIMNK